jgi:hypothetical protein
LRTCAIHFISISIKSRENHIRSSSKDCAAFPTTLQPYLRHLPSYIQKSSPSPQSLANLDQQTPVTKILRLHKQENSRLSHRNFNLYLQQNTSRRRRPHPTDIPDSKNTWSRNMPLRRHNRMPSGGLTGGGDDEAVTQGLPTGRMVACGGKRVVCLDGKDALAGVAEEDGGSATACSSAARDACKGSG